MKSKRILSGLAAAFMTVTSLSACSPSGGSGPAQLTLWLAGDCPKNQCLEAALIDGFEQENPGTKIDLVSQPVSNYFQLLKSASITGRGPDVANMWPGGYMTPFLRYMENINDFVPKELVEQSASTKYYAVNNDVSKAVYAAPTGDQWYVGFYNKKLFAENGVSAVPQTWDQLYSTCRELKSRGVLPVINGAQYGAAEMGPLQEFTYLASTLSPSDWSHLYDGQLPYDNPTLREQVDKWAGLYRAGCLNKDAINAPDPESQFIEGKAAMFFASGSWEIDNLYKKMGSNVGLIVPPFSATPQRALAETAGQAYAVMTYSKHESQARKFVAFILSDAGQRIIAKFGLPPTRPGFKPANPLMKQLMKMTADPGTQLYPMFDDYTQPGVTSALSSKLPQALVGQIDAHQALSAVDAAFDALPDDEKNVQVDLSTN